MPYDADDPLFTYELGEDSSDDVDKGETWT